MSTNTYGALFYTITGLHAAHVVAGVVFLVVVTLRACLGRYTAAKHTGLELCAMHWHFVALVWPGVLAALGRLRLVASRTASAPAPKRAAASSASTLALLRAAAAAAPPAAPPPPARRRGRAGCAGAGAPAGPAAAAAIGRAHV